MAENRFKKKQATQSVELPTNEVGNEVVAASDETPVTASVDEENPTDEISVVSANVNNEGVHAPTEPLFPQTVDLQRQAMTEAQKSFVENSPFFGVQGRGKSSLAKTVPLPPTEPVAYEEQQDTPEETEPAVSDEVEEEVDPSPKEDAGFTPATDTVISLPASDLQKLFKKNNIMPVPVHGITISIDLDEFARLSEANPRAMSTINALTASLEETLTPEDVLQIHDQQMFSFKTGATIMGVSDNAIGTSNLEVIVPNLITNLKVEEVNVDSLDFGEELTMIDVNPACVDSTNGLTKILKKSTVTSILNLIQTEDPESEYMFYAKLIQSMKGSNTYKRSLSDMRLMMQYALNCDTVLLQTVMTEIVVPKED